MRNIVNRRRVWWGSVFALALVTLVFTGCTVKFVSDYDDITDRAVTDLQLRTQTFLLKAEETAGTPAGEYASNTDFYNDARAAIQSIRLRAQAIPKNSITVAQLDSLDANFGRIRELHRGAGPKGLTPAILDPIIGPLNTQFKAIIKWELAKKRGLDPSK